jgi:signal recognition particle receptor subunit alpha
LHEPAPSKSPEKITKKGKEKRTWNDSVKTGDVDESLDFSGPSSHAGSTQSIPTHLVDASSIGQINEDGLYDAKELDVPDTSKNYTSSISKFFSSISSGRSIEEKQLTPIIQKMQEHLVHKNVATEISKMLCQSITQHLIGKSISTFASLEALVRTEFEKSLERVLSPKASTDLLKEANHIIQKEARPYVITFVGVNGVGKSTNLSKICFWLLQNRKRVLIAACDTFRSGAVEQLRVHVRNLMALNDNGSVVELYEKGYGKDSASIAKDAIQYGTFHSLNSLLAKLRNFDFVLVDTAGRMQDNEPLMRALSKVNAFKVSLCSLWLSINPTRSYLWEKR